MFVVGAGGSVPYGLLSGADLRAEILKPHKGHFADSLMYAAIKDADEEPAYRAMVEVLRHTGPMSVDAVIDSRPEFEDVGKAAIAAALLPLENEQRLFNAENDWIGYLIARMRARPQEVIENRVGFVTFNYDRVIEHRFTMAVAAQFNYSPERAWEVVQQIPIVHVYGQLGDYSPTGSSLPGVPVLRSADPAACRSRERVEEAAAGIRLMHSRSGGNFALQTARTLLAGAERIFFLGFGYDETNLGRLRAQLYNLKEEHPVVGTVYKLRSGEVREARRLIGENFRILNHQARSTEEATRPLEYDHVRLDGMHDDALATLREYADLLV